MSAEAVLERQAQIAPLFSAMHGMWPLLAAELTRIREQHMTGLVAENDEQLRGRIKQIDDLLFLPHSLRQELQNLSESVPDSGDSQ
jgi:hypothetical protein